MIRRRQRPFPRRKKTSEVQKKSETEVYAQAQARANLRAGFTGTVADQQQTGGIFSGLGGTSLAQGITGGSFRQSPTKLLGSKQRSRRARQIFADSHEDEDGETDGSTCRHVNVTWSEIQNGTKITTLTGVCIDCDEEVKSKINPNDIPRPKLTGKELEKQKQQEKERKIVESMWIRHKDYEDKHT